MQRVNGFRQFLVRASCACGNTERYQLILVDRCDDTEPCSKPWGLTNEFRIIVGRKILNTKILPPTGESLTCYSPIAKMNQRISNGTFAPGLPWESFQGSHGSESPCETTRGLGSLAVVAMEVLDICCNFQLWTNYIKEGWITAACSHNKRYLWSIWGVEKMAQG